MNANDRRSISFWSGIGNEAVEESESLERIVLKMYGSGPFYGGKSRSEIANVLKLSLSNVNKIINRRHKRVY